MELIRINISAILDKAQVSDSNILSDILFVGSYVNNFIVDIVKLGIPLSSNQINILLAIVYMGFLYIVINIIEIAKKPLKIGIIVMTIILIVGLLKPM